MGPPAPMADEPPLPPTLPINNNDEVEPSAEVFPPTPAAGQALDPATAERFQVPQQETFEQRRARVDRQETLSFGPRRSQLQSSHGATPYDRPARGDDDAAANMAFNVEDMEQDSLPGDWCFKPETGYFELREGARVRDFWELKAGCLLRHHCHQRRTLFDPAGISDIPVPLDKLDSVRVTIHFDRDGSAKTFTDDFRNPQHHDKDLRQHQLPTTWKGITVFQLNAETRKELNMFSSDSNHCYHVQNAKKVAQGLKNQHQRQQRRDVTKMAKNKGEVVEKHLNQTDPAELYTMEDEDMNEETYEPVYDDTHVEPYEPVEAYVATPKNAKVIKYVIAALTWLPTTSAMHAAPDHEHGQSGIWIFAILAMMLLCLLLGLWLGARYERLRLQQAMDLAYAHVDQLQREGAEQAGLIRRLRCQCYDVAGRRNEIANELEETRRNANVMAIMLASQIEAIRFLQARTDRLRSLIANHQAPCPLGDTVLVQPTLDGSLWHIDPECPIIELNRAHMVQEHDHCEYCARDRNMVTDRAFTGR
ncbi:unnamed protein product [Cladocopium goreaui]|uniref:Copia protein n=1 Tax=Cladocopium goreaui TaxID=2562237 RepID=A0A9P1CS65_9DINO|nr:unnamed protein product [Cladocopium goreaui]